MCRSRQASQSLRSASIGFGTSATFEGVPTFRGYIVDSMCALVRDVCADA